MTQILSLYIRGQWSSGETHRVEQFSTVVRTPTQMQEKNGTYEIMWPCPVSLTFCISETFSSEDLASVQCGEGYKE